MWGTRPELEMRWRVLCLAPIAGFGFVFDARPLGLRRQIVAHQRRGFYDIDKSDDFDPFAVLSLEIGALRAYEPGGRARRGPPANTPGPGPGVP